MAGVDSVDGSSMSRFGDEVIVKLMAATALALRERDELEAANVALEKEIERLDASGSPGRLWPPHASRRAASTCSSA
jgi:hypothetical protein